MKELVDLYARFKSFSEFRSLYTDEDARQIFHGSPLVLEALANKDDDARWQITNFLLDQDAIADQPTSEGYNAFHYIFSHPHPDPGQTLELTRRFLAAGADPGLPDARGMTPSAWLVRLAIHPDNLTELYDLWFAQPGLNLTFEDRPGGSALDAARAFSHTPLTARMEEYLAHPPA